MDTINLPVLSIKTPLREALGEMKAAKCSAVVAREGDAAWLFRAAWVVWGIAAGQHRLADLENRKRVHMASPSDHQDVDFINPQNTEAAIENLLDTVNRRYLMASSVRFDTMATIITRHESFKYDFDSGPADCYCTNPNRADDPHSYRQSQLPKDGKCVYDRSKIVCSS